MSDENKIPDLKIFNTLKEEDVNNAKIVTDDEFSDVIDAIVNKDYKNIPNSVRLPNIKKELAEKLGLEKDAAFILKQSAAHIRPSRKSTYGQAFTIDEYKVIPKVIRDANFAIIDNYFKNFQIVFDDDNNPSKINKLVFNKDRLGNYLVTIGKVDRATAFSEERNAVIAVGVAPTIQLLRTRSSSTTLRASPTTANQSIPQTQNLSSKNSHNLQTEPQNSQEANMENNHTNEQVDSSNKIYDDDYADPIESMEAFVNGTDEERAAMTKEFHEDTVRQNSANMDIRVLDSNNDLDQIVFADWFNKNKSDDLKEIYDSEARAIMSYSADCHGPYDADVVMINDRMAIRTKFDDLRTDIDFMTPKQFVEEAHKTVSDRTKEYDTGEKNYRSISEENRENTHIRIMLQDKDLLEYDLGMIDENELLQRQRMGNLSFERDADGKYEQTAQFYDESQNDKRQPEKEQKPEQEQKPQQKQQEQKNRKPYHVQNAEKILAATESGNAPWLPIAEQLATAKENENIEITAMPAVRGIKTGFAYSGTNQLVGQLAVHEAQRRDNALITYEQAKELGTFIKKGEKSIALTAQDKDDPTRQKVYHAFPVSSVADKGKLDTYLANIAGAYPTGAFADEKIECHDGDPEKYFGAYLAASQTGAKFVTDINTIRTFNAELKRRIESGMREKDTRVLEKIMKGANTHCNETVKTMATRIGFSPREQAVEKTQSAEKKPEKTMKRGGGGMSY